MKFYGRKTEHAVVKSFLKRKLRHTGWFVHSLKFHTNSSIGEAQCATSGDAIAIFS